MSYAAIVAMIGSIISVGYQSPIERKTTDTSPNASAVIKSTNPTVDQVLAADLAASTAQVANLFVASNASNLSISLNLKSELAQTNDSVLSKPQIVQSNMAPRGISEYTTVANDTVDSVALKYGLTSQTIRWTNRLTNDALVPGTKLSIPSTDGVIHTVSSGDSIESIASKYNVDKQRIITYNDLESSGVAAGQRIIVPDGTLPADERPEAILQAARRYAGIATTQRPAGYAGSTYTNSASVGNKYDYGYCTWYAYNRRAELGRPIGSFWGNATTWASYARGSGFVVNNTPAVGAVMQTSYGGGGYGHVAVVETVNPDGSIRVSEMNYNGWNVRSYRDVSAGQAASYNYIH